MTTQLRVWKLATAWIASELRDHNHHDLAVAAEKLLALTRLTRLTRLTELAKKGLIL